MKRVQVEEEYRAASVIDEEESGEEGDTPIP